jgi:cell division protein FtsN
MKKTLVPLLLMVGILLPGLLKGQSDKEIIKQSQALLDKKACDSAFFLVLTVKKTKSGKVQAIIKKSYPTLITTNVRRANKVQIIDKEDEKIKCEKYQKQIDYITQSKIADSLLVLNVKEDVYKSLSKKRSIDKSLATFNAKLAVSKEKMAKQEQEKIRIADSIALAEQLAAQALADSLAKLKDTITVTVVAGNPVVPVQIVNTSGGKYYIIAGAYKTESRAQSEVSKLKEQGFPNAKTVNRNDDGNLRICYNSYNDLDEAKKDLVIIRQKYRHDAWILTLP